MQLNKITTISGRGYNKKFINQLNTEEIDLLTFFFMCFANLT